MCCDPSFLAVFSEICFPAPHVLNSVNALHISRCPAIITPMFHFAHKAICLEDKRLTHFGFETFLEIVSLSLNNLSLAAPFVSYDCFIFYSQLAL